MSIGTGQPDGERASDTLGRGDFDRTVMGADDLRDDRQAQTCAAHPEANRRLSACEPSEDVGLLARQYPYSAVGYRDAE